MTSTVSPQSKTLSPMPGWSSAPKSRQANDTDRPSKKIGNVHLKWAFSQASVLFLRGNPAAQRYVDRLTSKHGKTKALSILAHKLGRAVYYLLKREQAFDINKFFSS